MNEAIIEPKDDLDLAKAIASNGYTTIMVSKRAREKIESMKKGFGYKKNSNVVDDLISFYEKSMEKLQP